MVFSNFLVKGFPHYVLKYRYEKMKSREKLKELSILVKFNILDYAPVFEGSRPQEALAHSQELAQLADQLGYHRYWVAEHHNVSSVASSSPEMLMMQLAASTERIRIGSGGVMLPHYSAYKVAENFRMLEGFHPNRIDLGIGRSPGFAVVNQALNEGKEEGPTYEQQITDLHYYFKNDKEEDFRFKYLRATPLIETSPEMWLLGSSANSAKMAAEMGMAYSFANFIPGKTANGARIIEKYRKDFQSSSTLNKPKVMVSIFVVVAETSEEAENLAEAFDVWMLSMHSIKHQLPFYPSPETAKREKLKGVDEERVAKNRDLIIVGNPEEVKEQIERLNEDYQADEMTIIPHFYGAENRLKGIRLLAEIFGLNERSL